MSQSNAEVRYRMCVAGSFAGLLAWAIGLLIPVLFTLPEDSVQQAKTVLRAEILDAGLIGALIGAAAGYFSKLFSAREVSRWLRTASFLLGALLGAAAGVVAAYAGFKLRSGARLPLAWAIMLSWSITGCLIGFVIGVLRYRRALLYVVLSIGGGLVGGAVGGMLLFVLGERVPHWTRAIGLMLTGSSICLFASLAVTVAARARILFIHSGSADANSRLAGWECELLARDHLLFGNARQGPGGWRFCRVPDPLAGPLNGFVHWSGNAFEIEPHSENQLRGGGTVHPLLAGSPPSDIEFAHTLQHGDHIVIGSTRFLFLLRVLVVALLLCRHSSAGSADAHLALTDRVRLLRVQEKSSQPVFRVLLNQKDSANRLVPIKILNPTEARQRVSVFEGNVKLKTCCVSFGALPHRFTILLLDVSGSMNETTENGRTKFENMKAASRQFVEDLDPEADFIAVVPFESHGVMTGIKSAEFLHDKSAVLDRIDRLPRPSSSANTGLFTAIATAVNRLHGLQGPDSQCLLIVMTDGKNDVRPGDDPDLETSIDGVAPLVHQSGVQVITIGFGRADNLNEAHLRRLAAPTEDNYHYASTASDLIVRFKEARQLQVDVLRVTFRPQQNDFDQLARAHRYRIAFEKSPGIFSSGEVEWIPGGARNVPEGVLQADELQGCKATAGYHWLAPLATFFLLHLWFWFFPPYLLSRRWIAGHLVEDLRQRAYEVPS